jgi:nucleotide-binding universal stress UspA family protein
MEDELRREGVNKAQVERQLGGEDVSWSCADTVGDLAACMLDAARTADLVVLNRRLDRAPAPDMPHIVGEVLMKSRALVLVVDDDLRGFDAAGKVLVAWDGSRTVMSTLQRATPLLALAEEVKLFQVGELGGGAIPIEEAAAYLSRHGIRANAQIAPKGPEGAAVAIRMEAERFGAAWCLMGAFKHGRLKEALFGGVARAMLGGCNLPLVMGH